MAAGNGEWEDSKLGLVCEMEKGERYMPLLTNGDRSLKSR